MVLNSTHFCEIVCVTYPNDNLQGRHFPGPPQSACIMMGCIAYGLPWPGMLEIQLPPHQGLVAIQLTTINHDANQSDIGWQRSCND